AVIEKPKIADDLRIQQTHGVGGDRVSETRMKLFRHRRAAHGRSAFEHLDFQTGHAEVGGASQPVVTSTDDDDVVGLHREALAAETSGWSRSPCSTISRYARAKGTDSNLTSCRSPALGSSRSSAAMLIHLATDRYRGIYIIACPQDCHRRAISGSADPELGLVSSPLSPSRRDNSSYATAAARLRPKSPTGSIPAIFSKSTAAGRSTAPAAETGRATSTIPAGPMPKFIS